MQALARTRRVVVVTGASAGVGRAAVRAFARRGYDVGLLARGRDGLEAARREVEAAGGRALVAQCDVADADGVDLAAERIERELGPIDVWVNNAMVSVFAPVHETTPAEFKRVTEVTYLGYVHGTLAALKRMTMRDRGAIVQVGSALAKRSIPLQAAYCAAKHAVDGFTESLRCELLHDGSNVMITVVQMPALNTPQFDWSRAKLPNAPQPVPPIFQPELAADAIVRAAENPSKKEWWVGWPVAKAILAEKVAADLADRRLAKTGYESQQTDRPIPIGRPDNLYHPVSGDHGARGRFDERSKNGSALYWASRHRGLVAALGLAAAAGTALVAREMLRA